MRIPIVCILALAVSSFFKWPSALGVCIPSGTETNINAALTTAGSEAILCAGAVFNLANSVVFTAANQQLYTEGLPTGTTRAILRVTGSTLASAILSTKPGTVIKNIQLDGNRPALGRVDGGGALIDIGGDVSGQIVDNVYTHHPRGWSCLHIAGGPVSNSVPSCRNATITNNQVGPAGTANQMWADGISLACGDSLVSNNVITDATDGAIVIFGAPGSLVTSNTIIAANSVLLGGINLVDFNPVNGNYRGTRVTGNTINAQGALIKVGIAMGSKVWGCPNPPQTNNGATVTGNTLIGPNFGYGYPVSGVTNWTVTGNVDNSRHIGVVHNDGCGGTPDLPAGYQYETISNVNLQSAYVSAAIYYVLGLTEPSILTVVQAPTTCGVFAVNQGLLPGQTDTSCDGRFSLTLQTGGDLVLLFGSTTLWSTGTSGKNTAQALMQADGNFVLHNSTGNAIWNTATAGHPGATFNIQNDGNLVIYPASGSALWASNTCCH